MDELLRQFETFFTKIFDAGKKHKNFKQASFA